MVSVAVSKLGKMDLVFVQPGAKIHNAYYCEQGLLVAIHRISNNDFVFKHYGARHACHLPHWHLPAFQCA